MTLALFAEIHHAVGLLPPGVLHETTTALAHANQPYNDALAKSILTALTNMHFRRAVARVFNAWRMHQGDWSSSAIAAALLSAAYTHQAVRENLTVELVWTGPASTHIPIRRTDQVLLQLIRDCQTELTLISFAIYKVPEVVQALLQALERGIQLRIIAKTPESGDGKIAFGLEPTFGPDILRQAQVLVWPKDKRPLSREGRYGALHIKGAIVDQRTLFITSANLTEYALTLNMELGVLVQNADLAQQLTAQINDLLHRQILSSPTR